MMASELLDQYLNINQTRFMNELCDLLRIPSISTGAVHGEDIMHCAIMLKKHLLKSGCGYAEVLSTGGNPVVYGEVIPDQHKPTVLIYGHYDVVPAGPSDLWETHPFRPELRHGRLYARGASDDKGQFFMHLKAMEFLLREKKLSNNIKFLIEGEEETGSPSLRPFLKENRDLLQADIILISDGIMLSKETPSIETGFRGFCAVDLEVVGANRELHSGGFGGIIANPIMVLSKMLASLHDDHNRICIPGFYDDVLELSGEERPNQHTIITNEEEYARKLGVKAFWGEDGYNLTERMTVRPTLEIHGILGGYTDKGIKSIIPTSAEAKISSRLVPNQSSGDVSRKIIDYLESIAPPAVELRTVCHPGSEPYTIDINNPYFKIALKALADVYKKPPVLHKDGGSLPLCHWVEEELGIKSILMGFGLQQDNMHGPDESFDLDNFNNGIKTIVRFHEYLG
jgi:acetylornithine deacetylase/succinyl-diaminopimelate desuccinylase-like protein